MSDVLPFDVALPHDGVSDETSAILRLINGDPIHATDRARIVSAIVYCAAHSGGFVDTNMVRARLTGEHGLTVYPRVIGAVYYSLKAAGVLVEAGWVVNRDTAGRNAGKPQMKYRYVRRQVAA